MFTDVVVLGRSSTRDGDPSSESSYATLNPDTVSDADTQEMTKLLEVISVTDSEVSTSGAGWVVSPSALAREPYVVVKSKRVTSLGP